MKVVACQNRESEHRHYGYYDLFNEDIYYKPTLAKNFKTHKRYENKVDNNKNFTLYHHLLFIVDHVHALINDYKNDPRKWKIQLDMVVDSIDLNYEGLLKSFHVYSDYEEIRSGVETGEIACKLYKPFIHNCQEKIKATMNEGNLAFERVDAFSYHIRKM